MLEHKSLYHSPLLVYMVNTTQYYSSLKYFISFTLYLEGVILILKNISIHHDGDVVMNDEKTFKPKL